MAQGSDDQPQPEPPPNERYGIVAFLRTRKDDGRSLILYGRVEDDTGAGAPTHPEPTGDGESA